MRGFLTFLVRLIPHRLRDRIKLLPLVGPLQRFATDRLAGEGEFVHTIDAGPAQGVRLKIQLPEDKGIWTGNYEKAFAERLSTHIRPGVIAFDIGAWHGYFTAIMVAQQASKVHVFEPLPENISRVENLITLNPDAPVVLHPFAVGDKDGETQLVVMPDSSMAKLESSQFQSDEQSDHKITVQIRTLDGLIQGNDIAPPDIIKLDIEGAELLALQGARQLLINHSPEIFAEAHSPALLADCNEFLTACGYEVVELSPTDASGVTQIYATKTSR